MLLNMRKGDTARDVARLIAGPNELKGDQLQRVTEQIRYWSKIDALTPSAPGSGTGHWKTFDEANVYTAGVLFEVSKYAPRWGFLTTVGQYLWRGVSGHVFYIDPDDPNAARVQRLKDENKKLSMIRAARDGEPDIYLGASSPSTWEAAKNAPSPKSGREEQSGDGPAKFLISELGSADGDEDLKTQESTSNDSDRAAGHEFPQVTAAEKAIAGEGRILVTKGAPTPPPMTSMIVVNLSEIFAMVRRSYEKREQKQNNREKE